ncbi:hypothetical protein QJS04_geneDACA007239 [Acorus gramineus]|uniref:Uncharacterized protein n=1 Tax=Acorus gramineus TaxID=55184 RepID=A0AAV9BLI8_ACOGR|nr:hypothetical protein QJS04_geneDACA007239 [Acorus gramineus]
MFPVDDNPDGSRACHEPKYHKILGNTKGLVGLQNKNKRFNPTKVSMIQTKILPTISMLGTSRPFSQTVPIKVYAGMVFDKSANTGQ